MNVLELDQEIGKLARAMMTRNPQIGAALIAHLRTQTTLECIASMLLISIERVIWFDPESIAWTMENLIPVDIIQEMRKIISFTLYKQFVIKGFVPGEDLSVDATGNLLIKDKQKQTVLRSYGFTLLS